MNDPIITSPTNRLVKALAALDSRRTRVATGRFLVEGRREVLRALRSRFTVQDLVVCDELAGDEPLPAAAGVQVHQFGPRAFAKISRRQNPDGIAARVVAPPLELDTSGLGVESVILVAEGIEKPGNLGSMVRTARALGADAVVLADPVTDAFNPSVIRASQGAIFTTRLHVDTTSAVIAWLRKLGLAVVCGYPEDGVAPWELDMTSGVAVVVGAEATGLTGAWDDVATRLTIPMSDDPAADSLNAATAAALLLYEVRRQRQITR